MPYAARMKELVDSFWRAAAYCLHPRGHPVVAAAAADRRRACWALGWFFWERGGRRARRAGAVAAGAQRCNGSIDWRRRASALLAPLIVVALAVPLIVVVSLLLVAVLMTPALVDLVAARRFPTRTQARRGLVQACCGPSAARCWRCAAGAERAVVVRAAAGAGAAAADLGLADLPRDGLRRAGRTRQRRRAPH